MARATKEQLAHRAKFLGLGITSPAVEENFDDKPCTECGRRCGDHSMRDLGACKRAKRARLAADPSEDALDAATDHAMEDD